MFENLALKLPENPFETESKPKAAWSIADRFIYQENRLDKKTIRESIRNALQDPNLSLDERKEIERIGHLVLGIHEIENANHLQDLWQAELAGCEEQSREEVLKRLSSYEPREDMTIAEDYALGHFWDVMEGPEEIIKLREKTIISKGKGDILSYDDMSEEFIFVIDTDDLESRGIEELDPEVIGMLKGFKKRQKLTPEEKATFEKLTSAAKSGKFGLNKKQESISLTKDDIRCLSLDIKVRQAERIKDDETRKARLKELDGDLEKMIERIPAGQRGKKLELAEMYILRRLIHHADKGYLVDVRHGSLREDLRPDMGSVDMTLSVAGDVQDFQVKNLGTKVGYDAKYEQIRMLDRVKRHLSANTIRVIFDPAKAFACYELAAAQDEESMTFTDKKETLDPLIDELDRRGKEKLLVLLGLTDEQLTIERAELEGREIALEQFKRMVEEKRTEEEQRLSRVSAEYAETIEQKRRILRGPRTKAEKLLAAEERRAEEEAKRKKMEDIANATKAMFEKLARAREDQEKAALAEAQRKREEWERLIEEKQKAETERAEELARAKAKAEEEDRMEKEAAKQAIREELQRVADMKNAEKARIAEEKEQRRMAKERERHEAKQKAERQQEEERKKHEAELKRAKAAQAKAVSAQEIMAKAKAAGLPAVDQWPPKNLVGFGGRQVLEKLGLLASPQEFMKIKKSFIEKLAQPKKGGVAAETDKPNDQFKKLFPTIESMSDPSPESIEELKRILG